MGLKGSNGIVDWLCLLDRIVKVKDFLFYLLVKLFKFLHDVFSIFGVIFFFFFFYYFGYFVNLRSHFKDSKIILCLVRFLINLLLFI